MVLLCNFWLLPKIPTITVTFSCREDACKSYLSLCRVRGLCPNSFNSTAFIFIIRQPPELRLKVTVPPRLEVTDAFDNMALAYLGLNKKRVVVVKNFSFFFFFFFRVNLNFYKFSVN